NPTTMQPGTYFGLIQVLAPGAANTPQEVVAVLRVLPPGTALAPLVQPASLYFTLLPGQTSPGAQFLYVYDPTGTSKSFHATPSTGFIQVLPHDATISPTGPVRAIVQPGPLPSGTYNGSLTFQFSDGRLTAIPITFINLPGSASTPADRGGTKTEKSSPLSVACTPQKLLPVLISLVANFDVPAGYPQGLEAQVLDDCGNALAAGSVIVEFSNGDAPVKLASLNNGRWQGTWQTSARQTSQVTLKVTAVSQSLNLVGTGLVSGG